VSERISVVIPVRNGAATLARCLDALFRSSYTDFECVVVDDHSTDDTRAIASRAGARVLTIKDTGGPARARNRGAAESAGEIILFIDADVVVEPNTLSRVAKAFADDPTLDALYGSYDDDPPELNFLSQYKNLMHCFVHQHGKREASTFWTGCGAIRRSVFLDSGGFEERYDRPSIEDIELGARLIRKGRRIELDPSLTVKHLKRWKFLSLLETDIFYRAVPWTLLVLREHHIPDDLNVQWTQRACVALMGLAVVLSPFYWPASCVALAAVIALNLDFYSFLRRRRGIVFMLQAIPMHLLYFLYSGTAFAVACIIALFRR